MGGVGEPTGTLQMKNIKSLIRTAGLLGVCVALFGTSSSYAVSGSWNVDAAGNWSDPANWTSNPTVPGGVGDTIGLTYDITADRTVTINTTPRTAGILNIGDSNASHNFTLDASGGGYLVMDNGGNPSQINFLNGATGTISAPIRVTANGLVVDKKLSGGAAIITASITTDTPGLKTITVNSAGGNLFFQTGIISGNIAFDWNTAGGAGFMSGANSFSGGFNLIGGNVRASNANSFGTGTITMGGLGSSNGTLDSSSSAGDVTIANNIVVSSANLANTLRIAVRAPNSTYTYSGNIDLQRELSLYGAGVTSTLALTGTVSGAGRLVLDHGASAGKFTLAADGSYVGGVLVDDHSITLRLGHAKALGTGTLTFNGTNAVLDSTMANLTLSTNNAIVLNHDITYAGTGGNSLNVGTGTVTFAGNKTLTVTDGVLTIGGVVVGGGNLNKAGAGVLALNGANTYSGETSVDAGTLRGNGSVLGDVYINSGATLEAGNSIGTFTAGGEAGFLDGSTFHFELNSTNGTYDQLVASSLSLESNVTFSVDDLGTGVWTGPASFVIVENTSGTAVDGIFDGYAEGSSVNIGENVFTISYVGGTGNDVTLTYNVIPEPGAWMLVTLGLGLTLLRRRRA